MTILIVLLFGEESQVARRLSGYDALITIADA
jgi:hypothetical protein